MVPSINKIIISVILCLVLCIYGDTAYANFEDEDSTLFSNVYNNKLYSSVIDAAKTIARPFLLQQGYLSAPGITILDTSLIYKGVTYLVSQVYNIDRSSGFYIPSSVYSNYDINNFKIIWPIKSPNIYFNNSIKTFNSLVDCVGFGTRVLSAVGDTTINGNAYASLVNQVTIANVADMPPAGRAADSYQLATAFATLNSIVPVGWQYIAGNVLANVINIYNHTFNANLNTYTGVRKGGFVNCKAGDLLVFGNGPQVSSTGHTMIIDSTPLLLNTDGLKTFFPNQTTATLNSFLAAYRIYSVNILDDCDIRHFNDSRTTINGIGFGKILIVTDTLDDAPIGYVFAPKSTLTFTAVDTNKTYALTVARYISAAQLLVNNNANTQATATITLNPNDTWAAIDSTMVGFSFNPTYIGMNFSSSYNGVNTRAITANLFNNFYPLQQPAIRINGTNNSYWKSNVFPNAPTSFNANASVFNCSFCPSGTPNVSTSIDATDLANVQAFVGTLAYKPSLYWGINLAYIDTARAADFCNTVKLLLNNNTNLKFELGNEPDAYESNARRLSGYNLNSYISEFNFVANKVKKYGSIVAPALAKSNPTSATGWADSIGYFINQTASNNVSTISMHTYPLGTASSGTVSSFLNKYLSDTYTNDEVRNATTGLYPSITTSNQNNLNFRLAESNTIASGGVQGVSDVMGSALWAIDMMFELAKTKAIGINFATEGSSTVYYSPFTYNSSQLVGTNKVVVNPIYYGALLFARAAQNNAIIISNNITNKINNPNVKVWSVKDNQNNIRILIINRGNTTTDTTTSTFTINLPDNLNNGKAYKLVSTTTPSLQATNVSIAGQSIDLSSGMLTGTLAPIAITPNNGNYVITAKAGTATLFEVSNGPYCDCR
jgi:hypothetical protein